MIKDQGTLREQIKISLAAISNITLKRKSQCMGEWKWN